MKTETTVIISLFITISILGTMIKIDDKRAEKYHKQSNKHVAQIHHFYCPNFTELKQQIQLMKNQLSFLNYSVVRNENIQRQQLDFGQNLLKNISQKLEDFKLVRSIDFLNAQQKCERTKNRLLELRDEIQKINDTI